MSLSSISCRQLLPAASAAVPSSFSATSAVNSEFGYVSAAQCKKAVWTVTALFVLIFGSGCFRQHNQEEATLKENLYLMRNAIDQFTQDKARAPQSLAELVSSGYLRAIPKDPFTNTDQSWQVEQEDPLERMNRTRPGISDVHSGSTKISG